MPRVQNYILLLIYATLLSVSLIDRLAFAFATYYDRAGQCGSNNSVSGTTTGRSGASGSSGKATDIIAMSSSSQEVNAIINSSKCHDAVDAEAELQFGKFAIKPSQIFYRSPSNLSAAIVNLRPIVPGHVLIISTRVVPLISDLSDAEYIDLWQTVRRVQNMLEKKYFSPGDSGNAPAFNIAVQDGRNAGQSVPHVHVHILPRHGGDFARNDDVYDELEAWAPRVEDSEAKKEMASKLEVAEDDDRVDRTMEQMKEEADAYRELMG